MPVCYIIEFGVESSATLPGVSVWGVTVLGVVVCLLEL